MNWDRQLSSILSDADNSVANIRGRLSLLGHSSIREEELVPNTGKIPETDFDRRTFCSPSPGVWQLPPVSPAVNWADVASIQSQLHTQNQVIESLTKKLSDIEQEKESQQFHIHTLQAEVDRLREDLRGRRSEKEGFPEDFSPEIRSSKVCQVELEHLSKEVDHLKMRLRRQEEAMMRQEKETRESRRQCQHNCEMLQELTDRYKAHSADLANRAFEYTQKEVRHISAAVSELEGEVKHLRERQTALPETVPNSSPKLKAAEARLDLDSDDLSPTVSLADISSEDLSLLDDLSLERQCRVNRDHLDREDDDVDDILNDIDDDVNLDLASDLSLTDL
ncbi:trichoplein keratin filament-binding protein [Corythoichthys intestinalis]|uniref:trichoplein keratin filament-binding protein n=1 Tax=Corythoichthys intestinalis TaxID=161448 RepID=UPI0025A520C8|nr:trichoplein keratin filament-binding protein [Corythoichthys intestinalis]